MRKKLFSLFLLVMVAVTSVQPVYATSSSELKKQREEKESQKNSTQSELDAINDQISDLSGEKEDVDAQIDELTGQIAEIMVSVDLMEEEIADTQEQIVQAQSDYDAAKVKEEEQYTAMKKRIQYLYEKGENSYLQILLEAKSWGDLLNKAEYVQEIYTYDRKMLDDYAATVKEVAQLKEDLEIHKSDLEASQYELEQEQTSLQETLDEQKAVSADYERDLARAQEQAAVYKEKIKKQNEEIRQIAAAEEAKRAEEEEERRRAEEESRRAEESRQAEEEKKKKAESSEKESEKESESKSSSSSAPAPSSSNGSATGSEIANYACQFVGNPYVPGGTSLTNGADCSGFTQSVYKAFGYSIPRTSSQQRSAGREVSYSEAQPGDLICYAGHVAIYLGNGRIVHASSVKTGIKYGTATYKTILSVRRIVN
ncbi:MAG TPA: C40 family peptidase [Candidatus Eisenbergiella pullistercoris]|uniref:C40 family peptidase n=1 Tax=Candidatus Eisenbergiella pullistercoris TaxID=2838555 RepID=A0A9D1YMR9_9FIRM|nr:C40 family peptidase [Candidatus Eisenbergiella pullistercoris]